MGRVGCYTLDLYCDSPECNYKNENNYFQVTGYDRAQSFRKARKLGWLISNNYYYNQNSIGTGKALCPKHSEKTT